MAIVFLPLPIQLLNGNVADGGQVMTDLNAIASNVNANAAKNGVNSDITSLTALISIAAGLTITGATINTSSFNTGTIVGSAIDATSTVPTAAPGTNTTQIANTAFVIATAFNAALPNQTGNNGAKLFTDGSVASWVLDTVFTVSGTYIAPQTGWYQIQCIAGGGGGGSGRRGAAASQRCGGAAGGAPGTSVKVVFLTKGQSVTVTIGAAGTAGAAITVNDTNGNPGTSGGNTTFGTLVTAFGGVGGLGGTNSGMATSGSSSLEIGLSNNASGSVVGGLPRPNGFGSTTSRDNIGEGGGACSSATTRIGSNTFYGGAGSSLCDCAATVIANSGSSLYGVSAASQGGWITGADTMPATAPNAGLNGTAAVGGGAVGGTCGAVPTVGGNGTTAADVNAVGNPGAGGGSSITVAGAAGGNGGIPGGPGGGGGASLNGNNSGAGGAGQRGEIRILKL